MLGLFFGLGNVYEIYSIVFSLFKVFVSCNSWNNIYKNEEGYVLVVCL